MLDVRTLLTYLTLISVPVGVFYHIMTLRNQARTREAQLYMQIWDRFASEEGTSRAAEVRSQEWEDFDDFERKYGGAGVLLDSRTLNFI